MQNRLGDFATPSRIRYYLMCVPENALMRRAMNRLSVVLIAVMLILMLLSPFSAVANDKVRMQLKWQHQFQFAGYYAAQTQGYYQSAGLDVEIIPSQPGEDAVQQVLEGKAEFGVGSTDLLLLREQGAPVVVLAVIFQHSSLALMTLKQSDLQSIHDLAGRKIMIEPGSAELYAYLNKEGISSDKFTLLPHSVQVKDLLSGNVDAMSAYVTDEPFELSKAGLAYQLYSPRADGIDFYGDNLFTTEHQIKLKPEMVKAFRAASLKGWEYAMRHPEELVQLIFTRYSQRHSIEHLRFEARQMAPLLQTDLVEIGHMNPGRWRHIANTYAELGMMNADVDLTGLLYDPNPPPPDLRWLYGFIVVATLVLAAVSVLAVYIYQINARLRREVSERRRAEEKLRDSESQYRLLIETANESILVTQGDRFKFVNPMMLELTGYGEEELLSLPFIDLVYPDDCELIKTNYRKRMKGEVVESRYQFRLSTKDKITKWVEMSGVKMEWDGQPATINFVTDITQRKRAEEALRESERFARSTVDALSAHLAILDESGTILSVNRAWREFAKENSAVMTGVMEGANYFSVCDKAIGRECKGAAEFAFGIHAVLKGNLDEFVQEYSCHAPTEKRWFIGRVTRFQGEGAIRLVVVHENITERKRVEEALQKALDDIKTLRGIIPICANCKKIRDDQGYWNQVDVYVSKHTEAEFSHGICPECAKKLYPGYKDDDDEGGGG